MTADGDGLRMVVVVVEAELRCVLSLDGTERCRVTARQGRCAVHLSFPRFCGPAVGADACLSWLVGWARDLCSRLFLRKSSRQLLRGLGSDSENLIATHTRAAAVHQSVVGIPGGSKRYISASSVWKRAGKA